MYQVPCTHIGQQLARGEMLFGARHLTAPCRAIARSAHQCSKRGYHSVAARLLARRLRYRMGHNGTPEKKPTVFLGQRAWVYGGLANLGWQSGGNVGEALAVEACPPGAVRLHGLTPDLHRDESLGIGQCDQRVERPAMSGARLLGGRSL